MINAIIGGVLIGLAVSLMLLFNGRVTGISGILGGIIKPQKNDLNWRVAFVGGLLFGGIILRFLKPEAFIQVSSALSIDYIIAGLLVGFGTLLGNGCTSGHGVCGISRLSIRSIVATLTFILFGVISVLIFKFVRGSL
ncbi:YeeE/YedE thiosulfate transporter family protein [Bacteriovorax sp. PP10]|uniref:YeeE/YedE thiosulfate transporter family protein n=1 Tax=Bacteriovorax antarcticus TaxID=3088717 RepID=A0ABU5VX04_9BACT|nr:YeeE/YedE thiosulfate transporter family protein [Bacteriovorax sp. PP10]MEA9357576.1 YeeE/YedE thiosulfate transporter family protein [Bacteriovorax sp. PP10]